MGNDADISAWQAAFASAAQGDSAPLVEMLMESVPLALHEQGRTFFRKHVARQPSKQSNNLKEAYFYFHKRRADLDDREAHRETCEKFKIKKASVLDNVLSKNRSDVNPLIARQERLLNLAKGK